MSEKKENKEARLKSLLVKNFGTISEIELIINGAITRLIGMNGSGKTTVTHKALAAAFRGVAEKGNKGEIIGSRYKFIGDNGKSADIIAIVEDVTSNAKIEIRNRLTANRNTLTLNVIEGPDNYILDRDWIYGLFNESLISARKFASLSSDKQALALGIDTSLFDKNIKALKDERRDVTREVKKFGEIGVVAKVEAVSVTELLNERRAIEQTNAEIRKHNDQVRDLDNDIFSIEGEIREMEEALALKRETLKELLLVKPNLGDLKEEKSFTEIDTKIENAETTNAQATVYKNYVQKVNDKAEWMKKETKINDNIEKEEQKKETYIKNFQLPFDDMTIDDNNGLLLYGRPINYDHFSAGEMEKIVAYIASSINPSLRLRIIDDFNLMDEKNQEDVIKHLTGEDFDIIINDVGNEKIGDNSILIQSGEIVD